MRRQQRAHAADILAASFRAVLSGPQRDDGDQPCFLIRNHYQASSESGYLPQGTGNGGRNGGFNAMRFLGLGHKFNAQSSQRGSPLDSRRRQLRGHRGGWGGRMWGIGRHTLSTYPDFQKPLQ